MCRCGRYQRGGFGDIGKSQLGIWDALPKIISLTKALNPDDKLMVVSKLTKSRPVYTFNRLAVLHAACHRSQLISKLSSSVSPLQLIDSALGYTRSGLHHFGP